MPNRAFVVVVGQLLLNAGLASAQNASQYIPIEHWTTPFIEHLIQVGIISDPNPLTRPLRRGDVLQALSNADTADIGATTQETVRRLVSELAPPHAPAHVRVEGYVGASWGTHARRNPLREAGAGLFSPHLGLRLEGAWGPFVASSHAQGEKRLREDPDYSGTKDPPIPGRFTDSYISFQSRYAELFFGATSRNWGPVGLPGTLVSPEPYSYDHLYVRVGSRKVRLETLVTELDAFRNNAGDRVRRFWATHRVVVQPNDWFAATLAQGTLLSGVGRGFELGYLNPLKLTTLTRQDLDAVGDSVNPLYAGSVRILLPNRIHLQGNLMLDDLASLFGSSSAPDRLAFTGIVDAPMGGAASGRLYLTLVSSLAYRSSQGLDQAVMIRDVGLGRNFADYWEAGVQASIMPRPLIVVQPHFTLLRQGEGDFRKSFPPLPARDHPFLFEGIVETTWRFGLGIHVLSVSNVELDGDAAVHLVRNFQHQPGVERTRFVGRIRVSFRLGRGLVL